MEKLNPFTLLQSKTCGSQFSKNSKPDLVLSTQQEYLKVNKVVTLIAYSPSGAYMITKYQHGVKLVTKHNSSEFKIENSKKNFDPFLEIGFGILFL